MNLSRRDFAVAGVFALGASGLLLGGSAAAAQLHLARTVCRRAERALVHLASTESVSDVSRKYLNRLSDLLFVLARALNQTAGRADVLWQQGRQQGGPA